MPLPTSQECARVSRLLSALGAVLLSCLLASCLPGKKKKGKPKSSKGINGGLDRICSKGKALYSLWVIQARLSLGFQRWVLQGTPSDWRWSLCPGSCPSGPRARCPLGFVWPSPHSTRLPHPYSELFTSLLGSLHPVRATSVFPQVAAGVRSFVLGDCSWGLRGPLGQMGWREVAPIGSGLRAHILESRKKSGGSGKCAREAGAGLFLCTCCWPGAGKSRAWAKRASGEQVRGGGGGAQVQDVGWGLICQAAKWWWCVLSAPCLHSVTTNLGLSPLLSLAECTHIPTQCTAQPPPPMAKQLLWQAQGGKLHLVLPDRLGNHSFSQDFWILS